MDGGANASVSTKLVAIGPTCDLFADDASEKGMSRIGCRLEPQCCWIGLSFGWIRRRFEFCKNDSCALNTLTRVSPKLTKASCQQKLAVAGVHMSGDSSKVSLSTVATLREEYSSTGLDESTLTDNPFVLFKKWLDEAVAAQVREPNAMCLATVDQTGRPSNRYVLLKGFDDNGFVWYTNYTSRKAQQLEKNPFAALTFWWGDLERSVRIEGKVFKVSSSESDEYFRLRPAKSRLAAILSEQSKPVGSRVELEKKFEELAQQYGLQPDGTCSKPIPRPDTWGGYRLVPDSIEFWKGMRDRLHDRIKYVREVDRKSVV